MPDDTGGPHLNAALICEKVLRKVDGVVSAVRIVDRFTTNVQAVGMELPGLPGQRRVSFTMLLHFRSGNARGSYMLKLELERPDGIRRLFMQQAIYFGGGDERGPVIALAVDFDYDADGLYWFRVILEERFVTQIPLRLLTSLQQLPLPGPPL